MPANTSVYNLSSQVLLLLTRINGDLQIDRREVMDALRQGANKILKVDYFESLKNGQRFIDPHHIAKFKDISVQKDTQRFDNNYIDLPCQYIALKNNEGIQRVWPVVEDEIDYIEMIPVPDGAGEVYRSLTVNDALVGLWTYSLQRDKLHFGKKNGETLLDSGIEKVDIDIVVISPVDVGDTEPFPLPPEYHLDLIQQTIQLFAPNPERVREVITQDVVDQVRLQTAQAEAQLPES